MVGWLAAAFGMGVLSALVPVVNLEAYLLATAVLASRAPWPAVAVLAASGQMVGKIAYYGAARGGSRLGGRLLRRHRRSAPGRWSAWTARFGEQARGRPVWTCGVLLVSGSVGMPPLLAMSVVAGTCRVHPAQFLASAWTGRVLRFGALLAVPGLLLS